MSRHQRTLPLLPAAVAALVTACGGAGSSRPAVVVYTSVDEVFARPIAEQFQVDTGIEVRLVPDTEETKSTGLLNRLIAERGRPQADVFWSGDPVRAEVLKRRGISSPYRSPAAAGLPTELSDPEGHWTGFSTRARVLLYNRDLVPESEAPRSVMDLLHPRFAGRAALANPLFGTTSMHAAALFSVLGENEARAFFDGFTANGGRVLSSNGEVRRRVANGELALGLTDTDDANVARLEGKPVGIVFPDRDGIGTLLVPNCAVLIAGAPHPAAGKRFVDYLLRPDTERALALSEAAQMPLRADLLIPRMPFSLGDLKPMRVDYGELATSLESLTSGFLKEWVDRQPR